MVCLCLCLVYGLVGFDVCFGCLVFVICDFAASCLVVGIGVALRVFKLLVVL